MLDQIVSFALNNPVLTAGGILAVCFILFVVRILTAGGNGYNTNENNIRRWG